MELLIWAGGRWRRVCPVTGRVEGWRRRARIVSYRRSALHELPVSALRSVVKGRRLPKQRIRQVNLQVLPPAIADIKPNRYGQTNQAWAPTKQKDACIQTDIECIQNTTFTAPKPVLPTAKLQQDKESQVPRQPERRFRSVSTEIIPVRPSKQQENDKNKAENSEKQKSQQGDMVKLVKHTDTQSSSEEDAYKELIIDEQDILLLRRYIETHNTDIDLYRFDADDDYKTLIFYKIHPSVRIERCPRIAQMIKDHDVHITVHFARQLGLRSVDDIEQIQQHRTRHRAVKQARKYFTSEEVLISSDEEEEIAKKNANNSRVNWSDSDWLWLSSDENHAENPRKVKRNAPIELTSSSNKEHDAKEQGNKKSRVTRTNVDSDGDVQVQLRSNKRRNVKEVTNDDPDVEQQKKDKKTAAKVVPTTQSNNSDNNKETNKDKNNSSEQQKNNNTKSKAALKMAAVSNTGNEQTNKKKQNSDSSNKNTERNPSNESNQKNESDEENQRPKDTKSSRISKRVVMPKKSSVPPGREYSMLEDQAIVAWLSTSTQRERAVNGNRIWRDLQDTYPRLTGQTRSWHSLRNRYLRYILPSLGALMLPPHHAQRLRAHASLGELKSRKQFRRNSVFRLPAVRSASARAPRPRLESASSPKHISTRDNTPDRDSSTPPSPKRRLLRSSTQSSQTPSGNTRSHSPAKPHTHSLAKPHTQLTHSLTRRRQSQSPAKRKTPSKAHVDSSKSAVNTGRTRSPHKAADRTRSPHKATDRTRSRHKSTDRTRSPHKSTDRTRSPHKATDRTRSPHKSTDRTRSPHKSTDRTRSPHKSTDRTRSPHKSTDRTRSPHKATDRTRSPHKSTDRTRSPHKSTDRTRSPYLSRERTKSPRSSPSYSEVSRRFALRSRSTPQQSPQPTVAPHKRRLYNPQRPAS